MNTVKKTINIMEVCGTHTVSIARFGLKKLFPARVKMLSGPGCPVCVTPIADIDRAIAIGKHPDVVIATFGDMLFVPGSSSSLAKERGKGMDVRVLYSCADALDIALQEPDKEIVFIGVGFETTAPTIVAEVLAAKKKRVKNFSVLPMFKTVPPALRAILGIKGHRIDGFLLPGHVSAIIGSRPYEFVAKEFGVPGVIAGFEPKDILSSIDMIVSMIERKEPRIEIQYSRAVHEEGNLVAQKLLAEVCEPVDSTWRAIGTIPASGLGLKKEFAQFDAAKRFPVALQEAKEPKGCACGAILLGMKTPLECKLFGKACVPSHPVGPCMVSSEGACAAVYKYEYQAIKNKNRK